MNKPTALTHTQPTVAEEVSVANEVKLGEWYWYTPTAPEDDQPDCEVAERHLVCIMDIGSNYVAIAGRGGSGWRVHFDRFAEVLYPEPNPAPYIRTYITEAQIAVRSTLREINELTQALGVSLDPTPRLHEGAQDETRALVLASSTRPLSDYKAALLDAKAELLPALFKRLKEANADLTSALKMEALPVQACIVDQHAVVAAINSRVFNIELYAGLTEAAVKIRDGAPAPRDTKLAVRQRMLFMDEECLARYRAGGMRFRQIPEFDAWLAEPEQFYRLLPEPRCCVAFRVRRKNAPVDQVTSISHYMTILAERRQDMRTFLYVRNGEQLWRVETALDFGERLFPDFARSLLDEPLMARGGEVGRRDPTPVREWEAMRQEEREACETRVSRGWYDADDVDDHMRRWEAQWVRFDPSTVWYDDIAAEVKAGVDHYNRVALILQGLFDRSPILHPHPPVRTWDAEGFAAAVDLVYDFDDALHPPDKPDFREYQAQLNASIKTGSVVVGQRAAWTEKRPSYSERWTAKERQDPGPADPAQVDEYKPRKRSCVFRYTRQTETYDRLTGEWVMAPTVFACSVDRVLNVDAYQLGDYRKFFDDPRTRMEYLKWAPLLLAAEDAKAGLSDLPPDDHPGWERTGPVGSGRWIRRNDDDESDA